MFRRSAVLVLGLLSTAAVGAAVAQNPAPSSKPKAAMSASQDTTHKAPAKAAKPTWTKDQIKTAQVGLVKAGLYKGDTNGVMNAATRKALKAYQKQNKMPATGHLNDEVLAKLRGS